MPAMKETMGFLCTLNCWMYSAASSSIVPPISPTVAKNRLASASGLSLACLSILHKALTEDETLGLGVLEEVLDALDGERAWERITSNADAERLTEANAGGLVDSFVGQSA